MSELHRPIRYTSEPHSALSRRLFVLGGLAGAVNLVLPANRTVASEAGGSTNSASCSLDHELTQGPYYLDRSILRKNITEGKPGLPLQLRLSVIDARTCAPLENAAVEIWHCDAQGIYSGYTKMNPDGMPEVGPFPNQKHGRPPGPPPDFDPNDGPPPRPPLAFGPSATDNTTFCRGLQLSDAKGLLEFETIYPGWYVSRGIHIHLKVHIGGEVKSHKYAGGHVSHTGQLFFPDELSDEIANLKPYVVRRNVTRTRLDEDNVVADAHGAGVMLAFERVKGSSLEAGLIGTAEVRVDPSAVPDQEHKPPLSRERG
jgi:protocatechuate 3,4-dioxygenase beta subunit